MKDKLNLIFNRAKYAAIGAAIGAAVGGVVSRNAASTGGAIGGLLGATLGETRVSAENAFTEFKESVSEYGVTGKKDNDSSE
ncbi:hypothetical protein ACFQH2_12835 [Natronoarchaeum sp. GCM10025703]|uniref:hypothetical protein n=1 Tax=unclassified Natronoarchaeum TaxID=2620183 RepID=UPI0036071F84